MRKPPPSDEEDFEVEASPVNLSNDEAPSSSVAKAYIQPNKECHKSLRTIYDCPMVCKVIDFKKAKKSQNKYWICKWCPTAMMCPRKFKGHNATKALAHVCGIPGQNIKECKGDIHPDWLKNYLDL